MNAPRMVARNICIALSCLIFFGTTHLGAQSLDAAGRPAEIAVTGGYIYGNPAYGPDKMQGVSFGALYTRYFHFPVAPSLEVRANIASTSYIKETTYLGGLRIQGQFRRKLHPYGDLLVGKGTISFKFPVSPNYSSDNSTIVSYGGGLGFDVFNNVQLTGDYQYQYWNLGTSHGGAGAIFHPELFTVGVKYTIPFHSYVGSSWRREKNK